MMTNNLIIEGQNDIFDQMGELVKVIQAIAKQLKEPKKYLTKARACRILSIIHRETKADLHSSRIQQQLPDYQGSLESDDQWESAKDMAPRHVDENKPENTSMHNTKKIDV